jgi:hypothetical protein
MMLGNIEADIYGFTTTRQILEWRYIKRAVTAHIITLKALYDLLLDKYQASEGPFSTEIDRLQTA